MLEIFIDSLIDTAKAIPFLLIVYFLIELIERKYSEKINKRLGSSNKFGPIFASLFGIIPQCGFSVMASNLYAKRIITLGTLLAVFISTSDEAIPVILAYPEKAFLLIPLLSTKLFLAIILGYLIDLIYRRKLKKDIKESEFHLDEHGCCGHDVGHEEKENKKDFFWHPIIHTAKISFFIFIMTFALNLIFANIGEGALSTLLLNKTIFQPIFAALIGLIPNCASSVLIAELFTKGMIGFGSAIAGLSSSAGLGLLILFKENKNLKENLSIIFLLFILSAIFGIIFQAIYN